MDALTPESKLVRWDLPFAEWQESSAWVIREGDDEDFTVVVAPLSQYLPKNNYPKYLVRFEEVITLLLYDERCATHRRYYEMAGWINGVRAYHWFGSPWLESYEGCFWPDRDRLHHNVIISDDNIVEVISIGDAHIERVDAKRFIDVRHEV